MNKFQDVLEMKVKSTQVHIRHIIGVHLLTSQICIFSQCLFIMQLWDTKKSPQCWSQFKALPKFIIALWVKCVLDLHSILSWQFANKNGMCKISIPSDEFLSFHSSLLYWFILHLTLQKRHQALTVWFYSSSQSE